MFVKKLLNFRAVVFFVVIGVSLFLNGGMVQAEAVCKFDTTRVDEINDYCKTSQMDEAEAYATAQYGGTTACFFGSVKTKSATFGKPDFYSYQYCAWNKIKDDVWKIDAFDQDLSPARAFCGWEDVLYKPVSNAEDNWANWSSCWMNKDTANCELAQTTAETYCSKLDSDQCVSEVNRDTHGCILVSEEKNGCYCNNIIAEPIDYITMKPVSSIEYKKVGQILDKNSCVDRPFSMFISVQKCIWYDNNKENIGERDKNSTNIGKNGCYCLKTGDAETADPVTTYVDRLYQTSCIGWATTNASTISKCTWKENNVIIESSVTSQTGKTNGCFCTDSDFTGFTEGAFSQLVTANKAYAGMSTTTAFISLLKNATPNSIEAGYKALWKDSSATVFGKAEVSCLNITNFHKYNGFCAWVVNGDVKSWKSSSTGKSGCYCNTVTDKTNFIEVPFGHTGKDTCFAKDNMESRPKCEWWESGAIVNFSENFEAKAASSKIGTTTPKTPGITVEELKNLASKELNPMKFAIGKQGVLDLIGRAVKALMYAMGSILFALYIYAGILWMTSSGSSEKVGMAKKIVVWSTLGVIVQLSAYMIVSIVFKFTGSN